MASPDEYASAVATGAPLTDAFPNPYGRPAGSRGIASPRFSGVVAPRVRSVNPFSRGARVPRVTGIAPDDSGSIPADLSPYGVDYGVGNVEPAQRVGVLAKPNVLRDVIGGLLGGASHYLQARQQSQLAQQAQTRQNALDAAAANQRQQQFGLGLLNTVSPEHQRDVISRLTGKGPIDLSGLPFGEVNPEEARGREKDADEIARAAIGYTNPAPVFDAARAIRAGRPILTYPGGGTQQGPPESGLAGAFREAGEDREARLEKSRMELLQSKEAADLAKERARQDALTSRANARLIAGLDKSEDQFVGGMLKQSQALGYGIQDQAALEAGFRALWRGHGAQGGIASPFGDRSGAGGQTAGYSDWTPRLPHFGAAGTGTPGDIGPLFGGLTGPAPKVGAEIDRTKSQTDLNAGRLQEIKDKHAERLEKEFDQNVKQLAGYASLDAKSQQFFMRTGLRRLAEIAAARGDKTFTAPAELVLQAASRDPETARKLEQARAEGRMGLDGNGRVVDRALNALTQAHIEALQRSGQKIDPRDKDRFTLAQQQEKAAKAQYDMLITRGLSEDKVNRAQAGAYQKAVAAAQKAGTPLPAPPAGYSEDWSRFRGDEAEKGLASGADMDPTGKHKAAAEAWRVWQNAMDNTKGIAEEIWGAKSPLGKPATAGGAATGTRQGVQRKGATDFDAKVNASVARFRERHKVDPTPEQMKAIKDSASAQIRGVAQ